ncbi:MAG: hypothetical protein NTY50_08995 [Methylobacter sp.]|nr:hypothetical protein [Methylobacter sp.]
MQNHIDLALNNFRGIFSRQHSWLLFSAIAIGFMAAPIYGCT